MLQCFFYCWCIRVNGAPPSALSVGDFQLSASLSQLRHLCLHSITDDAAHFIKCFYPFVCSGIIEYHKLPLLQVHIDYKHLADTRIIREAKRRAKNGKEQRDTHFIN